MPKILAVNLSDKDYSSAKRFAEDISYCTRGVLDFRNLPSYSQKLESYISLTEPDDFLLFSGPQIVCSIAFHIWMTLHGKCNVLLWEGHQYNLYTVTDNFDDPS